MLPTMNTKEWENSFWEKQQQQIQLQITKPQKINFLEGIWIICWGKTSNQTKSKQNPILLLEKVYSENL